MATILVISATARSAAAKNSDGAPKEQAPVFFCPMFLRKGGEGSDPSPPGCEAREKRPVALEFFMQQVLALSCS